MTDPQLSNFPRDLNIEQKRIARQSWPYVLGYLTLSAGSYIYLDLYHWDEPGAYGLVSFLVWALGYLLLLTVMKASGCFADGRGGGIGVYFGLCLITGLVITAALIVFVVPGFYLLMRWLPAYARALAVEEWITQTIRWSWRATEHAQKPLAIALLGPVLFYVVSIAMVYSYDLGVSYEASVIVSNLALSLGVAWLTILGVAAFGVLSRTEHSPKESLSIAKPA